MPGGLTRFDFYPRDWISGTRTLSDRARGVYVDLLAVMYDRGGAVKDDERWLCRFLGYRDARQLRPVIAELIREGKIEISDGWITNRRATQEIQKANERIDAGKKGGRPQDVADRPLTSKASSPLEAIPESDQRETSKASEATQQERKAPIGDGRIARNQRDDQNPPSPSPSPSPFDDVDDTSARQLKKAQEIHDRCCQIIGVNVETPGYVSFSLVCKWLAEGADPDLDIYPTIIEVMARRRGKGAPATLNYFTKAILGAKAQRHQQLQETRNDGKASPASERAGSATDQQIGRSDASRSRRNDGQVATAISNILHRKGYRPGE